MRTNFAIFVALFSLVGAGAAYAHHSFSTEYDGTKTFEIKGTVSKVEWTNPHACFYLDVKDARGAVTNWNFELGSPIMLRKLGWRQDSLKIGEQITVEGYLAKDGAKMANARKVTLADGRNVFAGSSADVNPSK